MSAVTSPSLERSLEWKLPYRGKVGMACLIVAESAIFSIFVVAYLFYLGKSVSADPLPAKCWRRRSSSPSVYCPAALPFISRLKSLKTVIGQTVPDSLGNHDRSRGPLFIRTALEWHRLIFERRAHHLHQSFWHNLLFTRRLACHSRHRGLGHAHALCCSSVSPIAWVWSNQPASQRFPCTGILWTQYGSWFSPSST